MPGKPQFLYTATTPIGKYPTLDPITLTDPKGPFSQDRLVYFFSGTAGDVTKPAATVIGVTFHLLLWIMSVIAIFLVREELNEDEDRALWDYATVCQVVVLVVFTGLVILLFVGCFQCFEAGVGYNNIASGVVTLITGGVASGCIAALLIVMGNEGAYVNQPTFLNTTTEAYQSKADWDKDDVNVLRNWSIVLLFCQVYIYNFLQNNKSYAEIREASNPSTQ